MSERQGRAHYATFERPGDTVTVTAGGEEIARSTRAVALNEHAGDKAYPPVLYLPREDVDMNRLSATARTSSCPIKGTASYYSIVTDDGTIDNAAWSYEQPLEEAQEIAGHIAFYPDSVDLEVTGS